MSSGLGVWPELLVRGGVGTVLFVALFVTARNRWKKRDGDDGTTDIGLD